MGKPTSVISVLFVCMGNICRSPTAEGVFVRKVHEAGLQQQIRIDSAGTHAYHIGNPPDERMQRAALRRGYDLSTLRARKVDVQDFTRFDYVLAMDEDNLAILQQLRAQLDAARVRAHLGLMMDFADAEVSHPHEVPDPYYGGEAGFERVLDMIEAASEGLLENIRRRNEPL
ncbi:MAG: phosphotyrosine protein phosphatase [Gammaproteobacteria bacterium 28-57-27]|nr:MAG: phosphotyrosine protein phosphatase [Gammaproteobacteria bacterium 28-57-27]